MKELDTTNFVKAVAQYFMDFLETDFHKHRSPRRAIKLQDSNSLLVGIKLNKYPIFEKIIHEHIANGFKSDKKISVGKNVYKSDVPKNLIDLVNLKKDKIESKHISEVVNVIEDKINEISVTHKKELIVAIEKAQEEARKEIQSKIVTPFIESIEESLKKLNLADEIIVDNLSEELTDIIANTLENLIENIIERLVLEETISAKKEITEVLNSKIVKEHITDYFEELKINDLYSEVFELNQNRRILDKQDFYLYFGTVAHNKATYPIFYIPFELKNGQNEYEVQFDSRVFVNKKSLEYISQSYNESTGRDGKFNEIKERILYLAQLASSGQSLKTRLDQITDELLNYFEIDGSLSVYANDSQVARNQHVRITNDVYFSLYDKSDEALINDYEELLALQENDPLFEQLNQLVNDFVTKDPKSVSESVDNKWDSIEPTERLVSESPIPLNSEQQKILSALRNDKCNYVSVEGPPGTGKSHTITAVVFDAILNNQSVLVLSDKKEALDVVEDKISSTMNSVRFEDDFQNPVLRLGKTGNTYKQILSPASIEKIKINYKAVRKQFSELESYIESSIKSLREDLSAESSLLEQIEIAELHELVNLEKYVTKNIDYVDYKELMDIADSAVELEDIRSYCLNLIEYLDSSEARQLARYVGFKVNDSQILTLNQLKTLHYLKQKIEIIRKEIQESAIGSSLDMFNSFSEEDSKKLYKTLKEYESLKKPVFGFKFSKTKVAQLDVEFSESFDSNIVDAHSKINELYSFYSIIQIIQEAKTTFSEKLSEKIDLTRLIFDLLKRFEKLEDASSRFEDGEYIGKLANKYPETSSSAGLLQKNDVNFRNKLTETSDLEYDKLLRYIVLYQKIRGKFTAVPSYDFLNLKNQIERLSTIKMTYLMDKRVVDFYENHAATVKTLKEIIASKEKFPREEFVHLKNAFPCILAGIRDYAEYIPLEKDLFDLVIIDEASQVSIAQAFPALLRSKKVLILGDKLQFGNVKAAQARSTVNTNYITDLRDVFAKNVSSDTSPLKKLEYFNVKKSILDFFDFISNYRTMLRKHFRGYKENISFSNKYFYAQGLQVMKIRSKPIDDVLKFSFIKHDGKKEAVPNTNIPEIEFIQKEIETLIKKGSTSSVGVITPHTNQQKKLIEVLYKNLDKDYLDKKLKLKIMTFDTCQGEERDTIFYSMVATIDDDKLSYIFSTDFSAGNYDDGLDDLRRQRLNVGLSRSKECMHFVLSKPITEYNGAIRTALQHYQQQIVTAKKEKSVESVDKNSPMEKQVLNWFYQTDFWNKNKDSIEFDTQFEVGEYLKQLDPTYHHPNYKVDFLLVYKDESEKYHSIIIEYDGFKEHFVDRDLVNEFNYENYMSAEDLERQKTLESYGYKFLRINKFNIGENPIATFDERLAQLLVSPATDNHTLFKKINHTIESINNGEMRECPKCGDIKDIKDFKDSSLTTGYGRFCMECKSHSSNSHSHSKTVKKGSSKSSMICSECGAKMKFRTGRYGKFYGCTRFPYCRNTVNIR